MAIVQTLVLLLVPACLGQFSIQGPSDGNRRAQGLKYSQDKGLEYSDIRESLGAGDFNIQGASDGSTDFQIQGASDGNANFHIQGATDGGSQAFIQGAYDANQDQGQQQPQYVQPQQTQGARVNWKSYNRGTSAKKAQEDDGQYREQRPVTRRPAHRRVQVRPTAKAQPQVQYQPLPQKQPQYQPEPVAPLNINPIDKAPPQIQELLQFQAKIPYENVLPDNLQYDALAPALAQAKKFQEEYPKQVLAQRQPPVIIEETPRSQFRQSNRRHPQANNQQVDSRQRRQAPKYEEISNSEQYSPAEHRIIKRLAQHHHSHSAPHYIQALLKFQSQLPYQAIGPKPVAFSPDRPNGYIPEAIEHQHQQHSRRRREAQHHQGIHYSHSAPHHIQALLKFQSQLPYQAIGPKPIAFSPDKPHGYIPEAIEHQHHQYQHQQQHSRKRRQTDNEYAKESAQPLYHRAQQDGEQTTKLTYKRLAQPVIDEVPKYSHNVPQHIQELLKFQAQIPYQIFPNSITAKAAAYIPDINTVYNNVQQQQQQQQQQQHPQQQGKPEEEQQSQQHLVQYQQQIYQPIVQYQSVTAKPYQRPQKGKAKPLETLHHRQVTQQSQRQQQAYQQQAYPQQSELKQFDYSQYQGQASYLSPQQEPSPLSYYLQSYAEPLDHSVKPVSERQQRLAIKVE